MSPQLSKAAAFVLDNPIEVGFASVRDLAEAADVKPNTLVRMAQAIGFEGYDDFREPFRDELRNRTDFTDRAAWLQAVAAEGRLGSVYADIAGAALSNLEEMFARRCSVGDQDCCRPHRGSATNVHSWCRCEPFAGPQLCLPGWDGG